MARRDATRHGTAYIHWGSSAQLRSAQDFAHHIDRTIHLGALNEHDLDRFAAVVVADGMAPQVVARHAATLNAYVHDGGFLIVFHQGAADWIDVVELDWRPIVIRDWKWWSRPGGRIELCQPEPRHPIASLIPLADMSWHWGGVYAHHRRAVSVLDLDTGDGSLFLDFPELPGGGRLMVSTLDPHSHNGQRFMPATTRFLRGFYPWLDAELGIHRPTRNRVTYLQCTHHPTEWQPDWIERGFVEAGLELSFRPLENLGPELLAGADTVYLPSNHDEVFLHSRQADLLDFLSRGGNLVICGEPATPWLPFVTPFTAVPPRPFTNLQVRIRDDRAGMFRNMEAGFDGWSGVFGQYARGWTEIPAGGVCVTEVGPPDAPKPADWLWRYPAPDGGGGFVFMHNGDNMTRYPDHGPAQGQLVRDVCLGLQALSTGQASL